MEKLKDNSVNNKLPRGGVLGSNTLYCNIFLIDSG